MIPNLRLTETERPEANGQTDKPAAPAQPDPWLLTLDDLSRLLQRSKRSLERDVAAGRLLRPIRNLGRALKWSAREIEGWIAAGCPSARAWRMRQGEANRGK
jgi:predicted DNA-binding transcriptional regulator AlpA